MYVSPRLTDSTSEVVYKLQAAQSKYDWTGKSTVKDILNATTKWDEVQETLHCCGVKSPKDWDAFRPKDAGSESFPVSCCVDEQKAKEAGNLCSIGVARWANGCVDAMKDLNGGITVLLVALIWLNLLLSLMASIVILCGPGERDNYEHY